MSARANRPLDGVTVIDLGQIYQGPYATLLMAKAGADIIKIEPRQGEAARLRAKVGMSATFPFAMLNSNKRGVTLNLKDARGRDLLKRMVAKADVLLENFAPGVMERLGVGWTVLSEINPRLIYASGTGYGLDGPDRDNLAMDLTVQAASGVMSITGFADGPPVKAGPAVVDFMSGVHLYAAVVTALYERTITGRGRLVEVAMQESIYPALASNLSFLHNSQGGVPPRTGNKHGGLAIAPYNVYPTADGHIAIITVVEGHWHGVLDAIGRPELKSDPRFANNAARVQVMAEVGGVRNSEAASRAVVAGARPRRGDARSAHASARDAGAHRTSGPGRDRGADVTAAVSWRRESGDGAQSEGRGAQRGCLRWMAGALGGRDRRLETGRGDLRLIRGRTRRVTGPDQ
jgi:crotonobetainyl-CoA:carnitine CoA-transferase CaiB-like acyl-CoA transferase